MPAGYYLTIDDAVHGRKGEDQKRIAETALGWLDLLLRKNADYGCSVWKPPVLCPDLLTSEAILVRMSDKITRLAALRSQGITPQVDESVEDTIRDLGAYCLLYLARPKPNPTPVADEPKFKVGDRVKWSEASPTLRFEVVGEGNSYDWTNIRDLDGTGPARIHTAATHSLTLIPTSSPEKKAAAEPRFKVGDKVLLYDKPERWEVVRLPALHDPFYRIRDGNGGFIYVKESVLTPTT